MPAADHAKLGEAAINCKIFFISWSYGFRKLKIPINYFNIFLKSGFGFNSVIFPLS
jgi:hypothetical protein